MVHPVYVHNVGHMKYAYFEHVICRRATVAITKP